MSSPLQIEANRRNSQKSTGPRTVAGKAASTLNLNSLKSGIYAEAEVIADESAADLQALVAAYAALAPRGQSGLSPRLHNAPSPPPPVSRLPAPTDPPTRLCYTNICPPA